MSPMSTVSNMHGSCLLPCPTFFPIMQHHSSSAPITYIIWTTLMPAFSHN